MCGIYALINSVGYTNQNKLSTIRNNFMQGQNRGPENSVFEHITPNIIFGFHRLAINGYQNSSSEQPLNIAGCALICNGEIYNWKELHEILGLEEKTGSDCEIIIHLYKKFGMEYTLNILDGVFSFVLYDSINKKVYIARDPYGVRPLFISFNSIYSGHYFLVVASELKMMTTLISSVYPATQFVPGTYDVIELNRPYKKKHSHTYHTINNLHNSLFNRQELALDSIRSNLITAVRKRVRNTDREIACLLSGGLDSSLITALVANYHGSNNLHTWSIGMTGSEDLKYAQIVADYIGTKHHSIELEPIDFINAIEPVIKAIESYDTTTVRASVGNWLICKFIKEQSNAKVIFNGDGSDEITGGYMYFHYAPNEIEFDRECKRLLKDIHYFDVLRSDRSISSHGLEARTPFLDKNFVQNYLAIPSHMRCQSTSKEGKPEKFLLRKAFEGLDFLPNEVLWRTKEAFSDGVSTEKEAWFEIVQKYAYEKYKAKDNNMTLIEAEKYLYREIFDKYYPECENIIPYMWMPKFVDAKDASARTLDVYKTRERTQQSTNQQVQKS